LGEDHNIPERDEGEYFSAQIHHKALIGLNEKN